MSNAVYPALPGLGFSVVKTPNWATRMQRAVSGRTLRTSDFVTPIWNFTLTYEWLDDGTVWGAGQTPASDLRVLMDFFNSRAGAFDDFLFRDPTDDTAEAQPAVRAPTDTTGQTWQLTRTLVPGGFAEMITSPDFAGSFDVQVNGISISQPGNWSINGTGLLTFMVAPSAVPTVSFGYFYRVYFPDSLDFENFSYRLWQLKQVKLTSVLLDTAPSLCFLAQGSGGASTGGVSTGGGAGGSGTGGTGTGGTGTGTGTGGTSTGGGGVPAPTPTPTPAPTPIPAVHSTIQWAPAIFLTGAQTGGAGHQTTTIVPSSSPPGTVVGTAHVTNSDGSIFAGRIFFAAPKFDAGGVFALQGNQVIINPAGPGVAGITGQVIDFITLDATP